MNPFFGEKKAGVHFWLVSSREKRRVCVLERREKSRKKWPEKDIHFQGTWVRKGSIFPRKRDQEVTIRVRDGKKEESKKVVFTSCGKKKDLSGKESDLSQALEKKRRLNSERETGETGSFLDSFEKGGKKATLPEGEEK